MTTLHGAAQWSTTGNGKSKASWTLVVAARAQGKALVPALALAGAA
jgi:hypothetical protein